MDGWPELDELKRVLDVESNDWDGEPGSGTPETDLSRLLSAAIGYVKLLVGGWDEDIDSPDANLSSAALRVAELMALKPEVAAMVASGKPLGDPAVNMLMLGHRRVFGVA